MVQDKAVLLDVTTVRILYASQDKTSYHKVMDKLAETILGHSPDLSELNEFEKEAYHILTERMAEGLRAVAKRKSGLKQYQNDGHRQMEPITSKDLGGRNL